MKTSEFLKDHYRKFFKRVKAEMIHGPEALHIASYELYDAFKKHVDHPKSIRISMGEGVVAVGCVNRGCKKKGDWCELIMIIHESNKDIVNTIGKEK
jgi:hypothetical protein